MSAQTNEEEEEKWVKHYASYHHILLVGEGDFSFALCLASSFENGCNIVATSLDSYHTLVTKYQQAKANMDKLKELGASVLHKINATKMKFEPDLTKRRFDRIVYNFPHAGFRGKEDDSYMIRLLHQRLVNGFFHNAASMLRADSEIHVTHKTKPPYSRWDLEGLALANSLIQVDRVEYEIKDYPGYNNKRGDGYGCDGPFPLGQASTFQFVFHPTAAYQELRRHKSRPLSTLKRVPSVIYRPDEPHYAQIGLSLDVSSREMAFEVFGWYFDHVSNGFGMPDPDITYNVQCGIRKGHERFVRLYGAENAGSWYIDALRALYRLSIERTAWLEDRLSSCYNYSY